MGSRAAAARTSSTAAGRRSRRVPAHRRTACWRGNGRARPSASRPLAKRERLQVIAVRLDAGGRAELDRRIAGEHWCTGVDDMAEEYDPAEAKRGRAGHGTRPGRRLSGIRTCLARRIASSAGAARLWPVPGWNPVRPSWPAARRGRRARGGGGNGARGLSPGRDCLGSPPADGLAAVARPAGPGASWLLLDQRDSTSLKMGNRRMVPWLSASGTTTPSSPPGALGRPAPDSRAAAGSACTVAAGASRPGRAGRPPVGPSARVHRPGREPSRHAARRPGDRVRRRSNG